MRAGATPIISPKFIPIGVARSQKLLPHNVNLTKILTYLSNGEFLIINSFDFNILIICFIL